MNFTIYVLLSIASGFLAGASAVFFFWLLYSRYHDRKLKSKMPIEELADVSINIKPQIDEKEVMEDERRRIEKIRQFEKLRRTTTGKPTVTQSDSFYSGKFQNGERSRVPIKSTESIGESKQPIKSDKPKSESFEWY